MCMTRRTAIIISYGLFAAIFPLIMLIDNLRPDFNNFRPLNDTGDPLEDWRECMTINAEIMSNESWIKWPTVILHCEKNIVDNINLVDIRMKQDFFRMAYKKGHDFHSNVLFFGNGVDEKAVNHMQRFFGWKNINYTGTWPLDKKSKQIYQEAGKEFPVPHENRTISAMNKSSIEYFRYSMLPKMGREQLIDFASTRKDVRRFDAIWLDRNASEVEILPLTLRNGFFDNEGLVVCQWHMTVHTSDSVENIEKLSELIGQIVAEKRYAIIKPFPLGYITNTKQYPFSIPLAIFMLNLEDPICIERYAHRVFDNTAIE